MRASQQMIGLRQNGASRDNGTGFGLTRTRHSASRRAEIWQSVPGRGSPRRSGTWLALAIVVSANEECSRCRPRRRRDDFGWMRSNCRSCQGPRNDIDPARLGPSRPRWGQLRSSVRLDDRPLHGVCSSHSQDGWSGHERHARPRKERSGRDRGDESVQPKRHRRPNRRPRPRGFRSNVLWPLALAYPCLRTPSSRPRALRRY